MSSKVKNSPGGLRIACADIGLLLWKNFKIQFRSPWATLFEILLPCLLVLVIAILRTKVDVNEHAAPTVYPEFDIDHLDFDNKTLWIIPYVRRNDIDDKVMSHLKEQLQNREFRREGPARVYQIQPYDSMSQIEDVYRSQRQFEDNFLCAVDFTALSARSIEFTLRFTSIPRNSRGKRVREEWKTMFIVPPLETLGPRSRSSKRGGEPGYAREGFLFMQHQLTLAAAKAVSGLAQATGKPVVVNAQRFPFPPYVEDFYLTALSFLFPTVMLFSFIFPAVNLSKSIVVEKERRLYETMKMMGLGEVCHYIAYFIKSLALTVPSVLIMVVLLCAQMRPNLAIINFSDYSLIFVFFILYSIANICFCFAISSFFSKVSLLI